MTETIPSEIEGVTELYASGVAPARVVAAHRRDLEGVTVMRRSEMLWVVYRKSDFFTASPRLHPRALLPGFIRERGATSSTKPTTGPCRR